MSAKVTELYVALGAPEDGLLVAKVWLERAGDLYLVRHAPAGLAGKFSYHASGLTHSDLNLIRRRTGIGEPKRNDLRDVRKFEMITGWMCPAPEPASGYRGHADTKRRKTLVHPMPPLGWYLQVWAIEPGRRDLAERIASTDPWPAVRATASLLADWGSPWLLVTLAEWTDPKPYRAIRYSPALPGRVPFIMQPDAYEGTWLEHRGPKWQPGQPFPSEWVAESRRWVARQRRNSSRGIEHDRPM